jgi:hypothetical protein
MRTGHHLAIGTTVMTAMLVSGCATRTSGSEATGTNDYCVPRMTVSPTTVTPGVSITLSSEDICDLAAPAHGWQVGVGSTAGGGSLVTARTPERFDGSFEVTIVLPTDFPSGKAYAGIDDWDYSMCPDNASCAVPAVTFEVSG